MYQWDTEMEAVANIYKAMAKATNKEAMATHHPVLAGVAKGLRKAERILRKRIKFMDENGPNH